MEVDVRHDILIDVSTSPFAFVEQRVRSALKRLQAGEVLKVRTRSPADGNGILALVKEARCDVLHSATCRYFYECLIRKL